MTNNKLTDTEVKKALECCGKDDCDNCPNTFGNCYANLAGYALDLINRYELEVEAWKHYYNECLTDLKNAHAEIEKLKNEVGKEFTCFVGDPHKVEHCPYLEQLEIANAEIERLKEEDDE